MRRELLKRIPLVVNVMASDMKFKYMYLFEFETFNQC